MRIQKVILENFKGCKSATYDFDGKSCVVTGKNGVGKTTIIDAWMWLWFDKDNQLNSNPNIRPNDESETVYEPTVTILLDVAEKPLEVKKTQKKKVSKEGKISLSNLYEINSVPKTERDFKSYFDDLDIDISNMLSLSHPEVFVSLVNDKKSREQMRSTLFEMASDLNDYDVAIKTDNIEELKELLKNYSIEEIQAIQAATVRKIKEEFGKNGEIIDAKISGKEALRVDLDIAEIELEKNAILDSIKQNEELLCIEKEKNTECEKLSSGILDMKFKLSEMVRKSQEEYNQRKASKEKKVLLAKQELHEAKTDYDKKVSMLKNSKNSLALYSKILEQKRQEYKEIIAESLSDDSFLCPTCKQEFPEERKNQIIEDFENNKKLRLEAVIAAGNSAKHNFDSERSIIESNTLHELEAKIEELEENLKTAMLVDIGNPDEVKETDAYKVLQLKILEAEDLMLSANNADDRKLEIEEDNAILKEKLLEIEKKINSVTINEKIDYQISELLKQKRDLEQEKANCEKILYQIDLLNRRKNDLLTEQVNSHFEIVNWRLYSYLKNGEYKDDCTPMSLDGKVLGESTNTALSVAMKLDIIKGLQKFYGKNYPVLIDGCECLDSNNSHIDTDFQLIMFKVNENEKIEVLK